MEEKEYTGVKVVMDGMHFEANKVPVEDVSPILGLLKSVAGARMAMTLAQEQFDQTKRNTPAAVGAAAASE